MVFTNFESPDEQETRLRSSESLCAQIAADCTHNQPCRSRRIRRRAVGNYDRRIAEAAPGTSSRLRVTSTHGLLHRSPLLARLLKTSNLRANPLVATA